MIEAPTDQSSYQTSYDAESEDFAALVSLLAIASDADGDRIKVDWYSSLDGYLGSGPKTEARLVTRYDSSQPIITARVTDEHGAIGEDSVQVIIWIPSDT